LSAAETAYLMAVMAQYRATPRVVTAPAWWQQAGGHVGNYMLFKLGTDVGALRFVWDTATMQHQIVWGEIQCLSAGWSACQEQKRQQRDAIGDFFGQWWELQGSTFQVLQGEKSARDHWAQAEPFLRAHTYGPILDKLAAGDYFGAGIDTGYKGTAVAALAVPVVKGIPRLLKSPVDDVGRVAPRIVDDVTLAEYGGTGGGHHVPAKSAFSGAPNYNPKTAPAIPNSELARLNVSHAKVTGAQRSLYGQSARLQEPITWEVVRSIERQALSSPAFSGQ
jgi:hypothetical protein